jgi:hypothetical protein
MAWAISVTERAAQTTGLRIRLFGNTASPETGTVVAGVVVPDLATLETALDKLASDTAYNELVAQGHQFVLPGSVQDNLGAVLHPASLTEPDREIEYTATVTATITAGNMARGVAAGIEAAQRAESVTGVPCIFAVGCTGNFGAVAWHQAFADVDELERAQTALNTDPTFVEFVDGLAGVYNDLPGTSTREFRRRFV